MVASATGGCASAVTPAGPGSGDFDSGAADGSVVASDVPPPTCLDDASTLSPPATYISASSECTPGTDCTRGRGIHVLAVDFRYPCACDASADPVIDVRFDVIDDSTPSPTLTIDAWIMSCVHAGYHATGTGFSFNCGSPLGPRGELGLLLQDDAGNRATVYLTGPEYCSTLRLPCRPSTMTWGDFDYQCGL
jgi:hypothetical protein